MSATCLRASISRQSRQRLPVPRPVRRSHRHYTQSLAIAREIGNKRSEGIDLGNLGDALVKLNRLDEAEAVFREAIPIGDDVFPVAAGAFRGSLSLLLAQQGQHDEAQALLEAGEPQVESRPEEHAKFLCKKGHVYHMAGDAEGARASLVQAQGMAVELKVSDDSPGPSGGGVGGVVGGERLAPMVVAVDRRGMGHRRPRGRRRSQTKSGSWR